MSIRQKQVSSDQGRETFTCPTCALTLHSSTANRGVTLEYDIAQWQKNCAAARSGTPCLCPDFRPQLWHMLTRANKR